MAGVVYTGSKYEGDDNVGLVNAGGKVYFYEPNTTTPKDTYSDSALTTGNPNPVILDSAGRASIWLNGDYSTKTTDSLDNILYTDDNINPEAATVTGNYNLANNGSFENDTDGDGTPDGWDLLEYTNSTNGRVTDEQNHGTASMKFVSTGNGGGRLTSTNFFEVNTDRPLHMSFAIKSSVVDVLNSVQILWYQADQSVSATPSTTVYTNDTTNPTSWVTKGMAADVPSDAAYAKIRLFGCDSSDATTGTTWFDDIVLREYDQIKGEDVASANDLDIDVTLGDMFDITGTNTINGVTTTIAGTRIWLQFDGVLTFKHNTAPSAGYDKVSLQGSADITTAAGDKILLISEGDGNNYRSVYFLASGNALLVGNSGGTIWGLILSNDTGDTNKDINVTAGGSQNGDNDKLLKLSSEITKRGDATWVGGDDAGGISSSLTAIGASAWYHVFLVEIGSAIDILFDTSITCANGITDHSVTDYRRIGSFLTNGSSNIIQFDMYENGGGSTEVIWTTPIEDIDIADQGISAVARTLSVPPDINPVAIFNLHYSDADDANAMLYIRNPDTTDQAPSFTAPPGASLAALTAGQDYVQGTFHLRTNTSSQVATRASHTAGEVSIWTLSYLDARR